MVAETTTPTLPGQPQKPRLSTGNRFSEVTRGTIRRLYIVSGQSPAQIAFALGLKSQQVRNLVSREGWQALKCKKGDRKKQLEEKLLARAQEDQNRVIEASAVLSEDLQLRTLNKCVDILDESGEDVEKRLQMASGAARNFVQITEQLRGRSGGKGQSAQQSGNAGPTLIFVGALERAQPKAEPRNVTPETPAIEIPPADPAKLT